MRYLSIQVSSAQYVASIWDEVIRDMQVRMLLGTSRNANELQRADLAGAVIMPKLKFVPTRANDGRIGELNLLLSLAAFALRMVERWTAGRSFLQMTVGQILAWESSPLRSGAVHFIPTVTGPVSLQTKCHSGH
ncbi:hypothetical protein PybrP1_012448 [[Pythium] brassicae (nom. inval.)]|nr:hypothetical protein PybrP1_012448 [[Pythium] brassicae (nom. inval.)]